MSEESGKQQKKWVSTTDLIVNKILLASISITVALVGLQWNRDSNRRSQELLQHQVDNQIRATDMQRTFAGAQLMSSMMPYLNCKSQLSATAVQVVERAAPEFSLVAANALLGCPHTPEQKTTLRNLRMYAQRREIHESFRRFLLNATSYLSVGLDEEAVVEYRNAYDWLPVEYNGYVDHDAARRAEAALSQGQVHEAAQLFEKAFARVDLNSQEREYRRKP